MPNVSIKKEKEDTSYNEDRIETPNNAVPARIVSLKSTKASKKGKTSAKNLKNVKVKTLEEIRQEKKKTTENHDGSSTATFVKPKPTSVNQARANLNKNVILRSLSVPVSLISLPNRHPGKRTFRVSSLPSNCVTIKREPVDSQLNTIFPATVRVKQESEHDFDYNNDGHNKSNTKVDADNSVVPSNRYQSPDNDDYLLNGGTNSDISSEGSSFDNLSSSIDFSDVPRGSTQDDDTMSLLADNEFEEETEQDAQTRQSGNVARKILQSDDLRETIQQNHGSHGNKEKWQQGNKQPGKNVFKRQQQKLKKWEKRQKHAQHNNIPKAKAEIVKLQQMEEKLRNKLLEGVVQDYTIKRGAIPQMKPSSLLEIDSHTNYTSRQRNMGEFKPPSVLVKQAKPPQPIPLQLKRRPIVPGGRGFFEDVPPITADTVTGHSDEICEPSAFKNVDINEPFSNVNHNKNYKTLKRRSTEEHTSTTIKQTHPQASKRNKQQWDKRPKQLYCNTQVRLGKCDFSFCMFKHLTESELEEYKKTGQVKDQDQIENNGQESEIMNCEVDQESDRKPSEVSEEEKNDQMFKGLLGASSQALDSMKLSEAWQLIYHLYETAPSQHPALIPLVERMMVLCGDEHVDSDIAAQVSSKAFDLIPKVRGDYNRHDFTTLIRCLCQTGQYIRAYEALNEMKALNISPTHEVFLDLINSSQSHPARAFDLLDEIKTLGLFRSSICSALILLSCKAKLPLVGRTWALFKDMMDKSIKPSKESFLALLDLLADNYEGEKLLEALVLYDDSSIEPSQKCNKIVVKYSKDNADMVSQCVKSVSEMHEPQLDVETWNILLSNCFSENFNLAMLAMQVQQLMKKFSIPFLPQGYNGLLCSLSDANLTITLMEVIRNMTTDINIPLTECKKGLTAAVNALMRTKQLEDLVYIVTTLIDNGIKVEEKPLLTALQVFETTKSYEKMHQIFTKCEQAKITMSVACFRKIYLSLEKWANNPAASLDVYAAMKLAYPIIPESSVPTEEETLPVQRNPLKPNKAVCRYYLANRCTFGVNCRFKHATSTDEESTSLSTERSNPFVLRSTSITDQAVQPPLPPPLQQSLPPPPPPPFCLAMNPLIPPSFPPVSEPFTYKDPGTYAFQPQTADYKAPIPPSAPLPEYSGASLKHETMPSNEQHEQPTVDLKTELDPFKGRIQNATEEQNFEELARIYVEMKNEKIPVCNEMLLLFYTSFTTFANIGESLSSFVAIIDIQLDNPDSDEVETRESFDSEDQKFIGELGVALMLLCRNLHRLDEGYLVLHVLHQYSINYFQYPASFVPNEKVLSSSSIALLAADMCLCLDKDPQFDGAVEVLRGCNYALPQEGCYLSVEESNKRRNTIQIITTHYLSNQEYDMVYEFLQHIGDSETFGMTNLKTIYNQLLKGYIDEKKVEEAIRVIREMESELISRDTHVLRSLVTCLGDIGRFLQAKDIFKSSCLQGAYPPFPQGEELWTATIWASFSKFEVQFYLEQHLQLLNRHVEQQRFASQMPYDEQHLKKLRITIVDEKPLSLGTFNEVREQVIEILGSEFNPPLSCGVANAIQEVVVNPRSLKRWFIANPTPESQMSPIDSDDNKRHQRNVSASEGHLSVKIDMKREMSDPVQVSKTLMEKIRHTICGHLTRYLRDGVIGSKEEFKSYARNILQDYFKQTRDIPADYNKQQRTKVINFVETYFVHNNTQF